MIFILALKDAFAKTDYLTFNLPFYITNINLTRPRYTLFMLHLPTKYIYILQYLGYIHILICVRMSLCASLQCLHNKVYKQFMDFSITYSISSAPSIDNKSLSIRLEVMRSGMLLRFNFHLINNSKTKKKTN